ncbi:MAG: hypothetical protein ABI664_00275 [bacterium]
MYRTMMLVALVAIVALVAGCDRSDEAFAANTPADSVRVDSLARARQDSINRTLPGYVVDSILPVEEELRRFRAALPGDSATAFTGGSKSREALVRRFVKALVANDTSDLQAMAVHGREFADLYYPESPYTHPPFRQSPALAWSLIQNPSTSGLTRLVRRLGGKPMSYVSHNCDAKVLHEGRNTRYAGCIITIVDAEGKTVTKRYFGSIVERDGQYKFMSYTNQF